ncbi:hypothetical protein EVAR_103530_1 [Eumeta japonica]|uniref:Uncharacterized protein n=1 Tax=Eumeta variegata TaxID=151549 RepID=A0A4C1YWB3_EUMVA|nr:hypothetical protein EVAR_103530_1 [Eumeta japonica]
MNFERVLKNRRFVIEQRRSSKIAVQIQNYANRVGDRASGRAPCAKAPLRGAASGGRAQASSHARTDHNHETHRPPVSPRAAVALTLLPSR